MELLLLKTQHGFVPATEETAESCKRFKLGTPVRAEVKQIRNYRFLQKYFVLLKLAFDVWSERCGMLEYRGQKVSPNFDRFRRDLAILCGFYEPVYNVKGEVRLEAKSIAFGNMDEEEFAQLYSKTIDVILEKIIPGSGYDEETLRNLADQMVSFA